MEIDEIKKRIKDLLAKGHNNKDIRRTLISEGADPDDVDFAFIDIDLEEEISQQTDIPQQNTSLPNKGLIVICPHCGTQQSYTPRKKAKRRHKYCKNCGRHFDVNPIHQQKLSQQNKEDLEIAMTRLSLTKTQKHLLEAIYNHPGSTQKQLSEKIKKSISTVSRNIPALVALGLVREQNIGVKIYYIGALQNHSPQKPQNNGPKRDLSKNINLVTVHNIRVKLPIKKGDLSALNLYYRGKRPKKSKMRNWQYSYFDENGLTFQVSTKNIFFWPMGVGQTHEEAVRNLEEKSWKIRKYLEDKYKLVLGDPEFYYGMYRDGDPRGPHYVPISVEDKDQAQEFIEAWSDRTPTTGAIESASKKFVERILGLEEAVMRLDDQITNISQEIQKRSSRPPCYIKVNSEINKLQRLFEQKLTAVRDEITNTMPSIMVNAFTSALKNVFGGGNQGYSNLDTPPSNFFL